MAPSTIAIKIEFGTERGGGTSSLSMNSAAPMPVMSVQSSAALVGDAAASELPTPMGGTAQMMMRAESETPAPAPGYVAGPAVSSASAEHIPTPFSGGFVSTLSESVGALPTPLDSAQGYSVNSTPSGIPTPLDSTHGYSVAEDGAPNPPAAPEAQGKKSRK